MLVTPETVNMHLRGEWRDVVRDAQSGRLLLDTGWDHNQVQDSNATLLAMFFREFLQGVPAIVAGPQYLAIGHGQPSWDTVPPTILQTDTTLSDEFYRQQVQAAEVGYIDPVTKLPVGGPTRAIQLVMNIGPAQGNGTWREFGFFGGDATAALDSGFMINWVAHSRIDKDITMSVVRTVRFTFQLVP